jgi:MYXO-CTERM domain-containing protein
MRLHFVLLTLGALALFAPSIAHAGCPQAGDGCDAVIKLDATFQGGPACAKIERTEPENGCVCQGYAHVANGCTTELAATDFLWNDGSTAIAAGATGMVLVEGDAVGTQHDEFTVTAEGQTFKLVLDYTVEHRVLETGCSAAPVQNQGSSGYVGIGLAALAMARLRKHRRRN